jgi:hypothetical protein
MKRNNKSRFNNIDFYKAMDAYYDNYDSDDAQKKCQEAGLNTPFAPADDTRFYGVFLAMQGNSCKIKVDLKRFSKKFYVPDEMKAIADERTGHYFIPAKQHYIDYNCNIFVNAIATIREEWNFESKPMIDSVLKKIKDVEYDFDNMNGILEPDEATMNSSFIHMMKQIKIESKRRRLYLSLYAQFFHQMVSKIEAVTLKVLTRNGYEGDRFDRNVLYAFKGLKQESVKELDGFQTYDLMYALWNFIKHNSLSTYEALKKTNPQILQTEPYVQGNLAIEYVQFGEELVHEIITGIECFFKEYCRLVFEENFNEAQWNYNDYFLNKVNNEIESVTNPLGIPWWI